MFNRALIFIKKGDSESTLFRILSSHPHVKWVDPYRDIAAAPFFSNNPAFGLSRSWEYCATHEIRACAFLLSQVIVIVSEGVKKGI